MSVRIATELDLVHVNSVLKEYASVYSSNDPHQRNPDSFVDGRPENIEDAGWLAYEGVTDWFPSGMLCQALAYLVMKALVANDECFWVMTDGSTGVQHPLVERTITFDSLRRGEWLAELDYQDPSDDFLKVIDSYHDLMTLFARKRIQGACRFH